MFIKGNMAACFPQVSLHEYWVLTYYPQKKSSRRKISLFIFLFPSPPVLLPHTNCSFKSIPLTSWTDAAHHIHHGYGEAPSQMDHRREHLDLAEHCL